MWNIIDEEADDTFPPEGEEVLVSDGFNYDVAWYIRSGEYKWLKSNVIRDITFDFKSFVPIKWKSIE